MSSYITPFHALVELSSVTASIVVYSEPPSFHNVVLPLIDYPHRNRSYHYLDDVPG